MTNTNPWENMDKGLERRVSNSKLKRIYWVTDTYGRYGISFRRNDNFTHINTLPKLHGIELQKRNIGINQGELNLVLLNKEEWQIFLTLCNNLISAAIEFEDDEASLSAVEKRLLRWQALLKRERVPELSVERQMGLLTELICLRDIVASKIEFKTAVVSWVGSDFDRQDFLLDDIAIEVKSHKTSKGEVVQVSSKYQLDSIKKKVVLISFSLTLSENGKTVLDVVKDIQEKLSNEDPYLTELFERKLLECDFVPEFIEKPLQGFLIDSQKNYLVTKEFPRIESSMVSSFIQNVNYSIELTYCTRFEIKEEQILE